MTSFCFPGIGLARGVLQATALFMGGATAYASPSPLPEICGDCVAEKIATCGGFLEGPTLDSDGSLWVTDVTGNRVLKVEPSGECTLQFRTDGFPNGAKFRPDGKLLVGTATGLVLYDPASKTLQKLSLSYEGQALTKLNDIALDALGGVYFTIPEWSSVASPIGRVFYRSPEGRVQQIAEEYAYPNGVVASPDGEAVIISEFAAKRLVSLPAITAKNPMALAHVFALTSGGIGVDGMVISAEGILFAANFPAGEVLVYSPDARLIGVIPLPKEAGKRTTNVALGGGWLYITEAEKGEVWRVKLNTPASQEVR